MAISGSVLQLRSDRFLRSGDGETRISLCSSGVLATCSELHGASPARVRRLCIGAPAVSLAEFSPHQQQHGAQRDDGEIARSNAQGRSCHPTTQTPEVKVNQDASSTGTYAPQGSTSCWTCNSDDSRAMHCELRMKTFTAVNFLLLANSTDTEMQCLNN